MRTIAIDLDTPDLAALEALYAELERRHELRNADPEGRTLVEHSVDKAVAEGRITEDDALRIRSDLDQMLPDLTLEAHFKELVPNRPALGLFEGAFPRRDRVDVDDAINHWIKDDPRRLAGVLKEMGRYSQDLKLIASGALHLADQAGIAEEFADQVVYEALQTLAKSGVSGVH